MYTRSIISYKEAKDFLLPRHYSGRTPSISYAFGQYEDGVLVAVLTVGKPASNSLCVGICGEEFKSSVFELNRLCVDGRMSTSLSSFVSWCLKELKEYNLIIVSYADTQMSHVGYIYQATNFIYTGATKSRTDKYVEGGKHSRHYDKESEVKLRKYRSSKHRYIYITADKRKKKQFLKALNYPILPYPKGDSDRYELGEYVEPIILEEGEKYKA